MKLKNKFLDSVLNVFRDFINDVGRSFVSKISTILSEKMQFFNLKIADYEDPERFMVPIDNKLLNMTLVRPPSLTREFHDTLSLSFDGRFKNLDPHFN